MLILAVWQYKHGPIDALKRSVAIMKKTWGESLTANFGIGVVVFLVSLVGIIPLVLGAIAIGTEHVVLGVVAIVIGVVFIAVGARGRSQS